MINVHFNGDMVRCPDIKAVQERTKQTRLNHCICKFNYLEDDCQQWGKYKLSHIRRDKNGVPDYDKHCYISHIFTWIKKDDQGEDLPRAEWTKKYLCPAMQRQYEHGRKQKKYKIDNKIYRQMASSAHYMLMTSEFKTLFVTLTFPPYLTKTKNGNEIEPSEQWHNQAFSKFMENLHNSKKYGVKNYIAVRERCPDTLRLHFHLLLSIRFTPFADLNDAWCHAISDNCEYSKNAFTTRKKTLFLTDPGAALRYVCKYFSKTRSRESESRIVFISDSLLIKHKQFDNRDCEFYSFNDLKDAFPSIKGYESSDYTTHFRITDQDEFKRFCDVYLYKLFRVANKSPDFMHLGYVNSLKNS